MLQSLSIKNTAIIDSLTVDFGENMNCMTGETGAGKSIILDSLCCLLGERVSKDTIRKGASEASVTGIFNINTGKINSLLEEIGITPEDDGTIILHRAYTESRNTCRVNGNVVPLSVLRKLGELLVDVHGQHDNHALLSENTHIELLDLFAGNDIQEKKIELAKLIGELSAIDSELESMSGDPKKRAQLIDLYNFQVSEIEAAALKIGEEEELNEKQKNFDNQEIITKNLSGAAEILSGSGSGYDARGAYDMLCNCEGLLSRLERLGKQYGEALQKIRDAKFAVQDAQEFVQDILDSNDFDPEEAKRVAERIDVLYELKRKYGNSIEEILSYGENISGELEKLAQSDSYVKKLNADKSALLAKIEAVALDMRKLREKAAKSLENGVMANLVDMEMSKVKFAVKIEPRTSESGYAFNKNGLDNVRFLISTNPGEDLKPLTKIASGGELSRIMLAIKAVLADVDEIPVLVFDEIDTGISGVAAAKVAEKFAKISKKHQLICVSHLAAIAAISDNNIVVRKEFTEDGVKSIVESVTGEAKVREIARLLDGNSESELSLAHARQIISEIRVKR